MRLIFDLETNGLLRDLDVIHCLVTQNLDTGEVIRYDDSGQFESITTGITILQESEELYGHNIAQYDLEAIKALYPFFDYQGKIVDTLILSRLFFTDMLDRDFRAQPANMPANLYGRHSLQSWGYRLGKLKGEYGKSLDGDWSVYTPEMLEYCVQDCAVTVALSQLFQPKLEQYKDAIQMEMELARIMAWQEREGFPFDVDKAQQLEGKLRKELDQISDEMRSTFLFVNGGEMTPKVNNSTRCYVKGAPFCKLREFNATSRHHIAWAFQTFRNWEPTEFTNTGIPKIDHETLTSLGTSEALKFGRILELQKHLGQLSEGQNAWLKRVENGRIHHACVLNTVTGRMAMMKPNLGQVPAGSEYRELFGPGPGRILVSADACGLELRCLSHYLFPMDGGKFAKELLEGDIHTSLCNIYKQALPSITRRVSKSCTYGLLYGCGDIKLGTTAGASRDDAAAVGKKIRSKVMANLTGFKELSKAVMDRASHGVITALDGRPIRIRKKHSALNALMQSAGAAICKAWCVEANKMAIKAGIDYWPVEFIHDQMSWSVAPADVDKALFCLSSSIKDIEKRFNFRVPLDCDPKSGNNWAEVH